MNLEVEGRDLIDPLRPSCNFVRLVPFRVNFTVQTTGCESLVSFESSVRL